MTKVFIGGSRRVSRLGATIRKRLDAIIQKRLPVIVGDANGADKAVQQYLFSRLYEDVEVFCSGSVCRNNVGNWQTRFIDAGTQSSGFLFYAAKDRVMAREATYGFMIWDGKSTGTLLNVLRLLQQGKKVALYSVPEKKFIELKAMDQWQDFMSVLSGELRSETERKAALEDRASRKHAQASFFPTAPA
ncbi:MAG: hypothetical protein MUE49_09185 [Rhodospirillales bacterium]|jgi:hypothetical protein|nr:hypothetical protein [Rhodospirillales bacterium]